ncbi:MAG: ERF family protein [Mariniphaga sp.]|nr:ERF family protein [Mariniphaga sp.]
METKNIIAALLKFQSELKQPQMETTVKVTMKSGGYYTFKYADLSTINDAIKEPLSNNDLCYTQIFCIIDGKPCLKTVLMHTSGESIESIIPLNFTGTAQDRGSEITYFRRYQLSTILGIIADEDTDNNHSTQEKSEGFEKEKKQYPEDNRPWLNSKQFDSAIIRIEAGETNLIDDIAAQFRMKKEYKEKLNSLKK